MCGPFGNEGFGPVHFFMLTKTPVPDFRSLKDFGNLGKPHTFGAYSYRKAAHTLLIDFLTKSATVMSQQSKAGGSTPTSNATEVPTFPEGGLITGSDLALLYANTDFKEIVFPLESLRESMQKKNEALFNAIMADLGDSRLADFGDTTDQRMQPSLVAAYPARQVEQVIRRHLNLPTTPQ
jgi:hypothetical protein